MTNLEPRPTRARRLTGLLVLLVLGCGNGEDPPDPGKPGSGGKSAKKTHEPPPPPFRGWEKPAAVLVFTGEQLGYIEPCGCAPETLAGGIGRRHDFLRDVAERGWPVTIVDLGSTIRGTRRQSEIKFETILAAYKEMGYAAIGLGTKEANLGADYLYSQTSAGPESETFVPFVSANVLFYGAADLPNGPVPFRVQQVGKAKVAITSVVIDDEARPELLGSDTISVNDAEESLRAVLPKIAEEKPDIRVLLAHTKEPGAIELAKAFPEFDVVLCTGPEEPASEPTLVGDTMVLQVGEKGKYVGVVGWFPNEKTPLKYELVHLDRFRFDETEAMHARMKTYQQRLFDERVASLGEPARHPRETGYVGAAKCGECHTRAFAKWKDSPHAHAYESLAKGHDPEKGGYPRTELEWINRTYDPECLACHVTGWDPENVLRYEGGFLNAEFASTPEEKQLEALLGAQGCENCHGPGADHTAIEVMWKDDPKSVDEEKRLAIIAAMKLEVVKDPESGRPMKAVHAGRKSEVNLCKKCHDDANSPKFEFADYWEKVKHPWRD